MLIYRNCHCYDYVKEKNSHRFFFTQIMAECFCWVLIILYYFSCVLLGVNSKEFIANVSLIHSYSFSLQVYGLGIMLYYDIYVLCSYYNFYRILFFPNSSAVTVFFSIQFFYTKLYFLYLSNDGNLNFNIKKCIH